MDKRDHAKRAGELISSGIDTDLRYAALELRMAMEIIAYEKLRFYAARLPAAVLETWQPPQAMKLLLELEPEALYDKQFRIPEQHGEGSETGRVIFAGEHFSFKLPWLKKAYHKVGNMLHAPTPKQALQIGPKTYEKIRSDLDSIQKEVERVASSRSDSTLANLIDFRCGICDEKIVCNAERVRETKRAFCFDATCGGEHEAEFDEEGNAIFYPVAADFPCINCRATIQVQHNKVAIGRAFACDSCKTVHRFVNTTWHYGIASAIDAGGA